MINSTIATTAINQLGLDVMGPASGQLAAKWADATPAYNRDEMTLTLSAGSQWRSMIGAVLSWRAFGANDLLDATGAPLTGVVGVLSFHPQAALRLQRLAGARFDGRTDGVSSRPVPVLAAIGGGTAPSEVSTMTESDPPLSPIDARVGTALTHGTLTFHDDLGLIIDPVAVACMFRELMVGFTALRNNDAGPAADLAASGSAGSVGVISRLGTGAGRRVHIVNIFGGSWVDRLGGVGLKIGSGGRLGTGPHDWADGQTLTASETNAGDLRFGFAREATLSTAALSPPAFPGTVVPNGSTAPVLENQFFRVIAVDLGLHLKGNRTADSIEDVPGADSATTLEPAPALSDGDTIDLLQDGQASLGAVSEVAGRAGLRLAVSPTISTDVAFPASRADRWPAVPPITETTQALDANIARLARSEVTAVYVGDTADVLLSWPAGSLPGEAHVRVFPRVDPGPATVPLAELDFSRRGDGVSGIAKAAGLSLLAKDPFRVGTGARPSDPTLHFDLLIVTRAGSVSGRLLGGLKARVGAGGIAPVEPALTNSLSVLPDDQRGISPSPLLGLTPTQPASGSDPVLAVLGEAAPRESPRFRTMARTETIVAGHDGSTPGVWQSVLMPGFLNSRSVRGDARLGNPGNPAGSEDHAPGLRVTGRVGLDLARAALRRTHHITVRLIELNEGRWNVPSAGTGTLAGAVLQNVAPTVESPELDLVPESVVHDLPDDWNGLISAIQSFLPPSLNSLIGSIPAPGAGDRWVQELRREAFAAAHGRRDSQWSLRWAIAHARRLIYLESPLFCATAAGTGPQEADLVALIRNRLTTSKDLRIIIATPRRIPFGPGYESFAQYFHVARNAAIDSLMSVAPKRVAVYHPIGFPGRPEVIRGSVAIVDDVWALAGSSSMSRRGLTFDGSIDLAFVDRAITRGVSKSIRDLRKQAMARTLGLSATLPGETPRANLVKLAQTRTAFELVREIVERGGDGLVEPLWRGLPVTELPALDQSIADPEGRNFSSALTGLAGILAELGQSRV